MNLRAMVPLRMQASKTSERRTVPCLSRYSPAQAPCSSISTAVSKQLGGDIHRPCAFHERGGNFLHRGIWRRKSASSLPRSRPSCVCGRSTMPLIFRFRGADRQMMITSMLSPKRSLSIDEAAHMKLAPMRSILLTKTKTARHMISVLLGSWRQLTVSVCGSTPETVSEQADRAPSSTRSEPVRLQS